MTTDPDCAEQDEVTAGLRIDLYTALTATRLANDPPVSPEHLGISSRSQLM